MGENKSVSRVSKPPWLKVTACGNERYLKVQALLKEHNLHTVCQEANCPNRGECFSSGTATFLILGPNCTRNCRFCNITQGPISAVDENEPANVAKTIDILGLKYAVITSVTRDDLPDGGAGQFVKVIEAVRALDRGVGIEILTPDFNGNRRALEAVFKSRPDVFNHNVETVPRLYGAVRPQADYGRSLEVLRLAVDWGGMAVKSGLMVGLGETAEELESVFQDIYKSGVEYLTIGQYLAPSRNHYPIEKYYSPEEFQTLALNAKKCGMKYVYAAPLVRSSYHAGQRFRSQ